MMENNFFILVPNLCLKCHQDIEIFLLRVRHYLEEETKKTEKIWKSQKLSNILYALMYISPSV